jgi:hypothetical protein
MSDIQIKTFQLQNASDEQSLNEFLTGKIVRHWETSFTPAVAEGAGVWNVFVAFEIRQKDERPAERERNNQSRQQSERPAFTKKVLPTNGSPRQNATPRNDAPARRAEKAPPEEYKPDVSERDFPLYDALRKWRNSRAREERVKPFAFFNNKQLEQLVTAKPEGADGIRSIALDMEPALWDKYRNELLAFVETAREAQGGTAPVAATPAWAAPVETASVEAEAVETPVE